MKRMLLSLLSVAILATAWLTGCDKAEPAKPKAEEKSSSVSVNISAPAPAEAILVSADAIDGKQDKIVSKCASCALGMDGTSEFTLQSRGYTMYFCSAACKDGFGKDIEASILAMKVPAK